MAWRYVSEERKIKEGRGKGRFEDYKPWIRFGETGSIGTGCIQPDWKHGRGIQCLSQGELHAYALLRWEDDVEDILEQYPLMNLEATNEIARRLGYLPSDHGMTRMTTDFIVIHSGRRVDAYSIKNSRSAVDSSMADNERSGRKRERTRQLQEIERIYWEAQGIPWHQWFADEMDVVKAKNILDVVSRSRWEPPMDDFAIVRYMLAHKIIEVDMSKKIEYERLISELKGGMNWTALLENSSSFQD